MNKLFKWRALLTSIICIIGIIFALPNFIHTDKFTFLPDKKLNYGLDLRGGSHLLIKVEFQTYLNDQFSMLTNVIRKELRHSRIPYSSLKNNKNSISFIMSNPSQYSEVKKVLFSINKNIELTNLNNVVTIKYTPEYLTYLQENLISQSQEIIRLRIDETGTLDPIIQKQGSYNILLQVPGLQNPQQIKQILGKTAKMTFHFVNDIIHESATKVIPPIGYKTLRGIGNDNKVYIVSNKTLLSGDLLTHAASSIQNGMYVVSFEFNKIGAKLFGEITRNNSGKKLGIVIDNKVISSPTINEPILGGKGIIQGNFTANTANELALLLRAGALPAPLKIIEERTVGPTLGQDSIHLGKIASVIAVISVIGLMIILYGRFGIFSGIALLFNLIFLISIMTILQATLTLPGIAGIVLTMGMAVDANVLIFERIKEEIKSNHSLRYSIKCGFTQAFATILDSNITTLIAAFFLYVFGTGVVKSFSVTLTIGILTSMFTAITLTKLMIEFWLRSKE